MIAIVLEFFCTSNHDKSDLDGGVANRDGQIDNRNYNFKPNVLGVTSEVSVNAAFPRNLVCQGWFSSSDTPESLRLEGNNLADDVHCNKKTHDAGKPETNHFGIKPFVFDKQEYRCLALSQCF